MKINKGLFIFLFIIITPGFTENFDYNSYISQAISESTNIETLIEIAEVLISEGFYEETALLYEQCILLCINDNHYSLSNYSDIIIELASIYRKQGLYSQAIHHLSNTGSFLSNQQSYQSLLGLCLYQAGQYALATNHYHQALINAAEKTSSLSYLNSALGKCYRELNDYSSSAYYFQTALSYSTNFWALYDYGKMEYNRKNYLEAVDWFMKAQQRVEGTDSWMVELINRKIAGTFYAYAWDSHSNGDSEQSLSALEKIINQNLPGTVFYMEKAQFWVKRW